VDDLLSVRKPQRVGYLCGDIECVGECESLFARRPIEPLGKRLSLEILHHKEEPIAFRDEIVEGADVRMRQARDRASFQREALSASGIPSRLAQQAFDRDIAAQPRVVGAVHLAHSPGADRREDFVRA
jgi:hypothetical protein